MEALASEENQQWGLQNSFFSNSGPVLQEDIYSPELKEPRAEKL